MKVACFCGNVYRFTYDAQCPDCGAMAFSTVQKHGETAHQFADRIAAFMKQSAEISQLPEVDDGLHFP